MEVTKGSDLILLLRLSDIDGQPMRINNTAKFKLYVWTTSQNNYLTYGKRDCIIDDAECDSIAIPSRDLACLESGVIQYTYDYAIVNEAFNSTDGTYDKVKTVVTDIYWRNINLSNGAANPVNYQTIEHLRDLIENEAYMREQAIGQINHYVTVEYTNALQAEIDRATSAEQSIIDAMADFRENVDSYSRHDADLLFLTKSVANETYLKKSDVENEYVTIEQYEAERDGLTESIGELQNKANFFQENITNAEENIEKLQQSVQNNKNDINTIFNSKPDVWNGTSDDYDEIVDNDELEENTLYLVEGGAIEFDPDDYVTLDYLQQEINAINENHYDCDTTFDVIHDECYTKSETYTKAQTNQAISDYVDVKIDNLTDDIEFLSDNLAENYYNIEATRDLCDDRIYDKFWSGTQAEYDALENTDDNRIYLIHE